MRARSERGSVRTIILVFVAVVFGVLIAQLGGKVGRQEPLRATVTQFEGQLTDRGAVLGYARSLPFDTAHGVIDEQYLTLPPAPTAQVGTAAWRGPFARVEPMRESHLFTRAELAEGRIVARMINRDSLPYPSLAMAAHDTSYMWVDSVATGAWRAVYVSSQAEIGLRTVSLTVMPTASGPGGLWPLSHARWVSLAGGGEGPWVPCTQSGCCWPQAQ